MVIAAIARAAARQDKGIARVLYCFPEEHFILAAVQIDYASKIQSCDYLKMAIVPNPQTSNIKPEVKISEPEVQESEPEVKVLEPEVKVSEPEVILIEPEVVVSEPDVIVSKPEVKVSASDDEEEGPFWMGPLVDRSFCELLRTEFRYLIKSEAEKDYSSNLKSFFGEKHSRITKLLDQLIEEESDIPWYHCLSDICSKLKLQNIPAKKKIINRLRESGFRASSTYFDSKCVKTNATGTHMKEVILGIIASEA